MFRECSPPTMCHMSGVTRHMSGVMCQVFRVIFLILIFFFDKVLELVGGGSVINGAYPDYFKKILRLHDWFRAKQTGALQTSPSLID